MAKSLRALIGFDHLADTLTDLNPELILGGLPLTQYANGTGTVRRGYITPDKWYSVNNITTTSGRYVRTMHSQINDGVSRCFWWGGRVRLIGAAGAATTGLAYISSDTNLLTVAAQWLSVLACSELPSQVAGTEYYLEVGIDRQTGLVVRYLDGNRLSDLTVNATILGYLTSRVDSIQFTLGNGATGLSRAWRDIYYLDCDIEDFPQARLGPIKLKLMTESAASGSGWASSSGSGLLADLNTALNASTLTAPVVTNAADAGDLVLTEATSGLAEGNSIVAVGVILSGLRSAAGNIGVAPEVGGVKAAKQPIALTTAMVHGKNTRGWLTNPAGTTWKLADVNSLKINVTPNAT